MAGALDPARAARWISAARTRCSRRSYTGASVPDEVLRALTRCAEEFRPFPGARGVVVPVASQSMFVGIVGAYGGISNAPSAMVLLGGDETPAEAVGYTGEALVLEATALGLDTCWVGGLFSAGHAAREAGAMPGERVFAVCALGQARTRVTLKERTLFGASHARPRRSVAEIAPGVDSWPTWARAAVDVVRLAPSAMNKQPWRLRLDGDRLVIGAEPPERPRISKRLDCGIAMLHAEIGALAEGVTGTWEPCVSPDVATFVPSGVATR